MARTLDDHRGFGSGHFSADADNSGHSQTSLSPVESKALNLLKNPIAASLVALLIVGLCLLAYVEEYYFLIAIPFLVLGAYAVIYLPRQLLIFLVFATPLSFNFENLGGLGGIGFYFPTEPLLFALMLLYIIRLIAFNDIDRKLVSHPLSIAIIINLTWIAVTVVFSTMPIVSFKFLLSRLWFILVMYFMINAFFKDEKYISRFLWAYLIGLSLAIIYTVARHSLYGFSEVAAHYVMWPFFKDHTSYGAILALFYPMVVFLLFRSRWLTLKQGVIFAIFVILTVGLVLSYTRAAWVSLVGALGVWFLIKMRINYKIILALAAILVGVYYGFETEITHTLERNRQDSSGDFAEHIQSITNISSDASNLERLNRWNSAIAMFKEKPVVGFGPGTYMFTYAIFQRNADRTIISTNSADGGNAHSEYLGPLSESGLPGALSILIIFILSLVVGVRLYYRLDHNRYLRGIVLSITLGLVTYYLHGVLNNYLDTDKASVPIWGMMSMLVAIELYHLGQPRHLNRQQSREVSSK